MKITGIICEYNPLHLGHKKQIDTVKAEADTAVVCLMSGNFVQRGAPAIIDKGRRAQAALLCGADLVLEMPVCGSLSSAEGFAAQGVKILSAFCDRLCFGAESADPQLLLSVAEALLSDAFPEHLRKQLDKGRSFPAARQAALEDMGINSSLLLQPNNILAIEYCKAILAQQSGMLPMPILRQGSYHDTAADPDNPSATALRELMTCGASWGSYVPKEAVACFDKAALHTLAAGERAILGKLRSMDDAAFEALPFGSEGLWRKLMHAARSENTLEDILAATKSKRYTRTRLDRMVVCAFLGITEKDMRSPAPYVRVLGFNERGREILKLARQTGDFPNIGERRPGPYQDLESRCGSLYGLFALGAPDAPDTEHRQRVFSI